MGKNAFVDLSPRFVLTFGGEAEARRKHIQAWEEAEELDRVVKKPGDEGRKIRDTSEFTPEELRFLRIASIFGIVGTFVWAFGELIGGLPHS